MRYTLIILSLILCSSCLGEEEARDFDTKSQENQIEGTLVSTLWVCHHPGSQFHNQRCVDDTYPNGCYVDGDSHKFCWLLTRKECDEEPEVESIQACKLFDQEAKQALSSESD